MKKLKFLISTLLLLSVGLFANENIIVYKVDNSSGKITPTSIASALEINNYTVAKNQDMNGPYISKFKKSDFQIYTLMSVYEPKIASQLVQKSGRNGIFVPFSLAVYQRLNDVNLYIAFLSAKATQEIVQSQNTLFKDLEELTKKTIEEILPKAQRITLPYQALATKETLYTEFSFEVDDEDALDAYDEFSMLMGSAMKPSGFIVANYIEYNDELKANNVDDYIFYKTYSLCKLKIIFELSKKTPEAGAFAPCTMVIYHKKGSNETKLVTLNVENLTSTLQIKDPVLVKMLNQAQIDMKSIIEEASE